jgi:hypothetical protein
MPYVRKRRRRTPSDKQLMKPLSDPGLVRTIVIGVVLLGLLGAGMVLMFRGVRPH